MRTINCLKNHKFSPALQNFSKRIKILNVEKKIQAIYFSVREKRCAYYGKSANYEWAKYFMIFL